MFEVSSRERADGKLELAKLDAITAQISEKGYAVVGRLVSSETCELLMAAILEDVARVRETGQPTRHEKVTAPGHLQLGLRRHAPYVRADLLTNHLIEHIVAELLGSGAWLGFYNGNVNLPGSDYQQVHFDRPYSWRSREEAHADGQSWPPPTTTLSCSIALADITEENGATEIYPGSHHETTVVSWPPGERVSNHPELLAEWQPPARMPIPAGAVCFRDPRMWHRGVPNPGDMPRPMIALTYHAKNCLHWRGRLIQNMALRDIEACHANPALKMMDDYALGDARLVFDEDVEPVLSSSTNLHAINRNVRYIRAPARVNHFLDAHEVGGARISQAGLIGPDMQHG